MFCSDGARKKKIDDGISSKRGKLNVADIISNCYNDLAYVKLHDIAFDKEICRAYNISFDNEIKEGFVRETSWEQPIMENINEGSNALQTGLNSKRKKLWKIKYNFYLDIIKSDNPIFDAYMDNEACGSQHLQDLENSEENSIQFKNETNSNVSNECTETDDSKLHVEMENTNESLDIGKDFIQEYHGIQFDTDNINAKVVAEEKCNLESTMNCMTSNVAHDEECKDAAIDFKSDNKDIPASKLENLTTEAVLSSTSNEDKTKSKKFKKPLLPESKRPPTRRTCFEASSTDTNTCSTISSGSTICVTNVTCSNVDADCISIYTSMNILDSNLNDIEDTPVKVSEEVIQNKQKYIHEWKLESAISKVCHKFLEQKCSYTHCRYSHYLPENMEVEIRKLTLEQLKTFTCHIKNNKDLYYKAFPALITGGKYFNDSDYLINLVGDVLALESVDKTPFISDILESLQNNGNSLDSIIQKLLIIHGKENILLCDILLSIVTSKEEVLINNWPSIKLLVENRDHVDFGVVNDMIKKCVVEKPVNVNLLRNICQDILVNHKVALDKIEKSVMQMFIDKLQDHHLHKQISSIKQQQSRVQCNVRFGSPNINCTKNTPVDTDMSTKSRVQYLDNIEAIIKTRNVLQFQNFIMKSKDKEVVSVLSSLRKTYCLNNQIQEIQKLDSLALNTMIELSFSNNYNKAYEILQVYGKRELEFIKTKSYKKEIHNDYVLKYLLLIKVFIKNNLFSSASKLLLQKDWISHFKGDTRIQIDRITRFIEISKEFFQKTVTFHLSLAKDVLMQYITHNILIKELDLWVYFNQILHSILKLNNKTQLWSMLHIIKTSFINIHKDILRMIFILFYDDLMEVQKCEFFNFCRIAGLYFDITGFESCIELPKNFNMQEAHYVLQQYFERRKKVGFGPPQLAIQIGRPICNGEFFLDAFDKQIQLPEICQLIKIKLCITCNITILNDSRLLMDLCNVY